MAADKLNVPIDGGVDMGLVVLGILLCIGKGLDVPALEAMSWWMALAPFAGAVVWWQLSDATGRTQRMATQRHDKKLVDRKERVARELRTGIRSNRKQGDR